MNWLKVLLGILVAAALGYGIGRYVIPAEVKIKTITVIKEVEVKNTHTVVTEITRPDGTKERKEDITTVENTTTDSSHSYIQVVQNQKPMNRVSIGALAGIDLRPAYTLSYERRLVGPIFIGIQGTTQQQIGISVGMEF